MRDDELIKNVDRRHVLQLFDLFVLSEYDAFSLIELYSNCDTRRKADEGSAYHILILPT